MARAVLVVLESPDVPKAGEGGEEQAHPAAVRPYPLTLQPYTLQTLNPKH